VAYDGEEAAYDGEEEACDDGLGKQMEVTLALPIFLCSHSQLLHVISFLH